MISSKTLFYNMQKNLQNSWYWTLSIFKYLLYFSSGVSASSDYNRVFFWGGGGSFRHSWKKDYDLGLMQKNACCALRHNKFTLMTLIITLWPLDRSKVLLLPTPDHEPWCHPLWPPTCSSNKTPLNIIWAVITFANRNNWMTPYTLNWRFWEHYTKLLLLSCLQNSTWSRVRHCLSKQSSGKARSLYK